MSDRQTKSTSATNTCKKMSNNVEKVLVYLVSEEVGRHTQADNYLSFKSNQ